MARAVPGPFLRIGDVGFNLDINETGFRRPPEVRIPDTDYRLPATGSPIPDTLSRSCSTLPRPWSGPSCSS